MLKLTKRINCPCVGWYIRCIRRMHNRRVLVPNKKQKKMRFQGLETTLHLEYSAILVLRVTDRKKKIDKHISGSKVKRSSGTE